MKRNWWFVGVGLLIALALTLISPLASPWPDGLERVAEDQGFLDLGEEPAYELIPDYVLPGIPNESLATILAGIVGVLLVFGVGLGAGYILKRRHPADETT